MLFFLKKQKFSNLLLFFTENTGYTALFLPFYTVAG